MLDVQKIVNEEVTSLTSNGRLESLIRESVNKTLVQCIESVFRGYSVKKSMEEKIQTETDHVLKGLSFASYAGVMRKNMLASLQAVADHELIEKTRESMNELLGVRESPLDLSEIIEEFINSMEYDQREGLWVKLNIQCKEQEEIVFARKSIYVTMSYGYHILEFDLYCLSCEEDEHAYKIYSVRTRNVDRLSKDHPRVFNIEHLTSYERLVLNAFYTETDIVADITSGSEIDLEVERG